jgi:hypothetical protein
MTFDVFENKITDQLDRMLGGDSQSGQDIAAITVNRWPHGYAYAFNSLFDKKSDGLQPYEIARQRRGTVAIANSDAGRNTYAHEAIDQAWRAVNDLKNDNRRTSALPRMLRPMTWQLLACGAYGRPRLTSLLVYRGEACRDRESETLRGAPRLV